MRNSQKDPLTRAGFQFQGFSCPDHSKECKDIDKKNVRLNIKEPLPSGLRCVTVYHDFMGSNPIGFAKRLLGVNNPRGYQMIVNMDKCTNLRQQLNWFRVIPCHGIGWEFESPLMLYSWKATPSATLKRSKGPWGRSIIGNASVLHTEDWWVRVPPIPLKQREECWFSMRSHKPRYVRSIRSPATRMHM